MTEFATTQHRFKLDGEPVTFMNDHVVPQLSTEEKNDIILRLQVLDLIFHAEYKVETQI